jgi:hypothetical protein
MEMFEMDVQNVLDEQLGQLEKSAGIEAAGLSQIAGWLMDSHC